MLSSASFADAHPYKNPEWVPLHSPYLITSFYGFFGLVAVSWYALLRDSHCWTVFALWSCGVFSPLCIGSVSIPSSRSDITASFLDGAIRFLRPTSCGSDMHNVFLGILILGHWGGGLLSVQSCRSTSWIGWAGRWLLLSLDDFLLNWDLSCNYLTTFTRFCLYYYEWLTTCPLRYGRVAFIDECSDHLYQHGGLV